ncbi:hypothetical protein Tco_0803258, partial [Tanacetum coccineum]
IIAINLDTSSDNNSSDSDNNTSDSASTSQISTSEEIDYDSLEYKGPPKRGKAQASEASSKAKVQACGSKAKVKTSGSKAKLQTSRSKAKLQTSPKTLIVKSPVPITNYVLGLANAKTWDTILSKTFNYFPSIDKDITDNDITDEDCIYEPNSAMSKDKYVPVSQKHNPKVKSLVPVTGRVLELANITTWDEIVNKMGMRKSKICANKAKGKRKVSYGSSLTW